MVTEEDRQICRNTCTQSNSNMKKMILENMIIIKIIILFLTRAPFDLLLLIVTHFFNSYESRFRRRSSTSLCLFATFVFAQNLQHALILFKIVLVIALLVYLKFSYLIRFLIFQISHLKICSIVFRNILTHVSFSLTPVIIICRLRIYKVLIRTILYS